MDNSGNFVVVWQDDNNENNIYQIYAAGFNENGSKKWHDVVVNAIPCGQQITPSANTTIDGISYYVWTDEIAESNTDIHCVSFNNQGVKQIEDFKVNHTTSSYQRNPKICMFKGLNRMVIVWEGYNSNSDYDIYGKVFTTYSTF